MTSHSEPPPDWRDEPAKPPPEVPAGWLDCGGSYVAEDFIWFTEGVWKHSSKLLGYRQVIARVVGFEADADGQWVCLEAVHSEGKFPLDPGTTFRRRRWNVERNGVIRRLWDDESARAALVERG